MRLIATVAATLALALPVSAEDEKPAPSPGEIVNAAPQSEWVTIPAEDLLVMTLAPDAEGKPRQVIIQLMPPPFSQGWISNIRTLARAKWYDGITVNRVQDNYVVQWGDANGEDAEKAKPLPEKLKVMGEESYLSEYSIMTMYNPDSGASRTVTSPPFADLFEQGPYGRTTFTKGWPIGFYVVPDDGPYIHPVHCYGMVGVGRNYSPDTGSGAELYTVIGHAPRHLDRNIALVGRIISGMEHLSSLPRGSGALGFYTEEEADKRTPILSVRVASELPEAERPRYEYLSTEGPTFAKYAEARANRRDPFFIVPAGGADICNIPVPIRAVASE